MSSNKVVIAFDSFKESASASELGIATSTIFQSCASSCHQCPSFNVVPLSDGGEGLLSALCSSMGMDIVEKEVQGPLPDNSVVRAQFGMNRENKIALVEMAEASGLPLVPHKLRNPMETTSFGTGQLLKHASESLGARKIYLGVGGTSTVDGGCGALQALGVVFYDQKGEIMSSPLCGKDVSRISKFEVPREGLLPECDVTILVDVTNPLLGPLGASYVFGPQKGATPEMLPLLETGMCGWASLLNRFLEKHGECDFDDISVVPGAGAAGGISGSLLAILGSSRGRMMRGVEFLSSLVGLEALLSDDTCCLAITGEGCFDRQTQDGKAVSLILELGRRYRKPILIICGKVTLSIEDLQALSECDPSVLVLSLKSIASVDECMSRPLDVLNRLFEKHWVEIAKLAKLECVKA